MKKLTIIIFIALFNSIGFQTIAQQTFIKLDASFYSPIMDEVKMIDIYLPGDYYVNPEQQYATIYYLHGGGGNQNEGSTDAMWYYNLHNENTTINSPPAIFVCPDGSCTPYMGSMWMNSELYGSFEDYMMQDVIGFVENNFRAIPHKNFRYVVGWSMGGFGAANLSTKHSDQFRACVTCTGGMAMTDTSMNSWKSSCYEENGSYNLSYTGSGFVTQVLFTCAGAWSPNLDNELYYIDIPFDTNGNWVDIIVNKWKQYDMSSRVKDLPKEDELSWFLVCGRQDELCSYPTFLTFMDSMDLYGIKYDTSYFDGGHTHDVESWMTGAQWFDSIINLEYQTMGIKIIEQAVTHFTVFPNPVKDYISIDYELSKSSNVLIYLTDQQGKQLPLFDKLKKPVGKHKYQFNMSDLEAGVYYITLNTESNKLTKKIIKL